MKKPSPDLKQGNISAIDLFCGAGGLTRGLIDAGISVVAGYDIDASCQFAYEYNNPNTRFINKSVADIESKELRDIFGASVSRILVGCAPCQPFSKYTQGQDIRKDTKWSLLHEFARLAQALRPEIVSMENVPELQRHEIFHDFIRVLRKNGYHVSYTEAYCPDYGIPQQRKRLVLLASRLGEINLENYDESVGFKSVRETIAHLPRLKAGQSSKDRLHRCSKLSPLNEKRIKFSKPGGCWRDWPEELIAKCHRTEKGKNYSSVYGRMEWDNPAPTITTQFFGYGNGRFGHPEQNRAISLREGALLQTFPEDYEFIPSNQPVVFSSIGKMIGNAVPVRLGTAIGISIQKHLKKYQSDAK